MEFREMTFTIEGIAPLMMHNGQLANPLNKWSKAIKSITGKRKKTDEDHEEIARLEFLGGLYVDKDGEPCIPGVNLEGCFVEGAKKQRLGTEFKAGMFCDNIETGGNWKLIYKGPKKAEELWADERFRDIRKAGIKQSSVMRCRPHFAEWSLKFAVQFDPEMIDAKQLPETLGIAGRYCGLCDHTPKFGRFVVKDAELDKAG